MTDEKTEKALAKCLAMTYRNIEWKKVGVKSAYTYFTDRVRAASRMSTITSFLEELNRMCGVSFTQHSLKDINTLKENEDEALNLLRHETNYAVLLALEVVEKLKMKKAEDEGDEV